MTYFVYTDEAGISHPQQEPYLVVAGVVVNADKKLVAVEHYLEHLVERHIPSKHQQGFVFHATELFNGIRGGGDRVFARPKEEIIGPLEWPLERRLQIAHELAAIPKQFDLPIAFGFLKRADFPKAFTIPEAMTPGEIAIFAHVSAFLMCATMVNHWMRRNAPNEVGLMIVENNESARTTIRDVQRYHQDRRVAKYFSAKAQRDFPLSKIKEDPLFQDKRPTSVLQVADFCAYVFKRFLMNEHDARYLPFFNPMRSQLVAFTDL